MKKTFFATLAIVALAAMAATAQTQVSVGVKGGLNIPKITAGGTKTPLSEGYSSRTAGAGGFVVEFRFDRHWSLVTGLEYSGQGGKNDNTVFPSDKVLGPMMANFSDPDGDLASGLAAAAQAAAAGNPTGTPPIPADPSRALGFANLGTALQNPATIQTLAGQAPAYLYTDGIESTTKFNYIMLPVQARYSWNLGESSPWRVYAQAGIFGSYLVSAKRVMTGSSALYVDQNGTTLGSMITGAIKGVNQAGNYVTDQYSLAILNNFLAGVQNGTADKDGIDTPKEYGTQGITKDLYRWNVGVIGAAGINYNLKCRHNFFFEAGGNYGFVKLQKNAENGQNRIGAGSLQIGYAYSLGKICRK